MIVKTTNLSLKINEKEIIKNLNIEICSGDFIVIFGESGSGKTTLLNNIGLLDTSGIEHISYSKYKNKKKDLQNIRKNSISYIFQNYALLENLSVKENLSIASKLNKNFNDKMISDLLKEFSLSEDILAKKIHLLSGGEQQRIALIRSLIKPFEIIFADEPTGNLDDTNAKFILNYLKKITVEDDKAVVLVTHDFRIKKYATQIIDLNKG